MELSGPFDFVQDKNAARKKIDDKSSALPTTPVTQKGKEREVYINEKHFKLGNTKLYFNHKVTSIFL